MNPLRRLAAGVLSQALHDARKGCPKARHWLLTDSPDLRYWCKAYGVRAEKVRLCLRNALEGEFADQGARERMIAAAFRQEPGLTNSELARRFGCHRAVVRKVRLKLEAQGERPSPSCPTASVK